MWRRLIPEERSGLPKTTSAQHCELYWMPLSTALPITHQNWYPKQAQIRIQFRNMAKLTHPAPSEEIPCYLTSPIWVLPSYLHSTEEKTPDSGGLNHKSLGPQTVRRKKSFAFQRTLQAQLCMQKAEFQVQAVSYSLSLFILIQWSVWSVGVILSLCP
jgi:hypothetical protein